MRPTVQIFEIVASEKEDECIRLVEVDTVDLSTRSGRQVEPYMVSQYSCDVQLAVDNNLQLTLVMQIDGEVLVFFGEDNVSDVARKGKHVAQAYTFHFNPGAIIWYSQNTIEYVIYRCGVAEFRTVGIELSDEEYYLQNLYTTGDERSIVLFYKFGEQAQLVIWDLVTNTEVTNFAPKEGVYDVQILNGASSDYGYLLGDKRIVNL